MKDVLRSKCCGTTLMSVEGESVYCSRCGGICEIMSPEHDRIERMLKHLVIKNQIDFLAITLRDCPNHEGMKWHYADEEITRIRKKCTKEIERLKKLLPDLKDIIGEKA